MVVSHSVVVSIHPVAMVDVVVGFPIDVDVVVGVAYEWSVFEIFVSGHFAFHGMEESLGDWDFFA